MVSKQSVSDGKTSKKSSQNLANQKWMEEFGVDDSSADSLNGNGQHGEFATMFEQSLTQNDFREGAIKEGKVMNIGDEYVTVDVGYKCEGLIPLHEFKDATGKALVNLGDTLSVYLERLDIESGQLYLSKDKANIIKAWDEISAACDKDQVVEGIVLSKVKGGLCVDIGVKAFLPGSQIDTKPVKSLDKFVGKKMKFKIIKFNKKRGNIVLSRRAVIAQEVEVQRAETLSSIQEGMVVKGIIKNITDYGAFIDLGGVDGLLHITDMSWGKIKHPEDLFKPNEEITVKVLKYDKEKGRVSLGYKQVSGNPWDDAEMKYPVGKIVKGKVIRLKDFGAFVELEDGIEGLIHVSEMSWTERVKHPNKMLKEGDEVECKVLEVDGKNKRISLGIKQLSENPWDALELKYPVGTIIDDATVKSITDFGVFLDVGMGIDGLVHVSDMSWSKKAVVPSEKFKKDEKVRVVVLGIDKNHEKFSLGIKQLERDPWDNIKSRYRQGQAIEGLVTKLADFGAFVELEEGVEGLIYVSEISENRIEKPADALKVGDQVRAEIISIDPKERRIGLSIKQLSKTEERASYENYAAEGNKKMSMGDLLGDKLKAALSKKKDGEGKEE